MFRQVICCFLLSFCCNSLLAQRDRDLVLIDQENKYNIERIVVGDLVSIKTTKGYKNWHNQEITEISDTTLVLEYQDTIAISSISAITDKSFGKTYYKTAAIMALAGTGSTGIFMLLTYSLSNIAFAGQMLTLGFAAFAVPFAIGNLILGKVKNSKTYHVNEEEWGLKAQQSFIMQQAPR